MGEQRKTKLIVDPCPQFPATVAFLGLAQIPPAGVGNHPLDNGMGLYPVIVPLEKRGRGIVRPDRLDRNIGRHVGGKPGTGHAVA